MKISLTAPSQTLDIGHLLDSSPFSLLQKWAVIFAATSIIFDGLGVQLIGYAIPRMAHDWGVTGKAFAPVVGAGLLGMVLGSACAGIIADRFGRRSAVIGSLVVFALATASISMAQGIPSAAILRFLAGAGIGGALPTSSTVVAEFTPTRLRTVIVTCAMLCVPCGGMFGGFISAAILSTYGWRLLFLIGGALPAVLSVLLLFLLPESPRYLARHPERWPELARLLTRMGKDVGVDPSFTEAAEHGAPAHARLSALFSQTFLRDTVSLWSAFLLCMFAIYGVFSWLPTALVSAGITPNKASFGLTGYNAGGIAGAIVCSLLIARYGSKWPLIASCAFCSLAALAAAVPGVAHHFPLLMIALVAQGFFANAVQCALFTLGAFIYPTAIRARGMASAASVGRIGATLTSLAGAIVLSSTATGYFLMLSAATLIVLVALAYIRRHIPARA